MKLGWYRNMRVMGCLFVSLLFFVSMDSYGQAFHWFIRSYNYSLFVSLKMKKSHKMPKFKEGNMSYQRIVFSPSLYGDYGNNLIKQKNQLGGVNYRFLAHEIAPDLGLLFFPSRVYSATEKRFLQPDPASQYFSPYLFVAADPINNIDFDGNVGKPLFLTGLTNKVPFERTDGIIRDAHYYSLSDLFNKTIPANLDWDGSVYINAHMLDEPDKQIELERVKRKRYLQTRDYDSKSFRLERFAERQGEGADAFKYVLTVDGEHLGAELKLLSERVGRPLNNVVMAGCQGEEVARKMREGFHRSPSQVLKKGKVNFFASRSEYNVASHYMTEEIPHSSWMFAPKEWIQRGYPMSAEKAVTSKGRNYEKWVFKSENDEKLVSYGDREIPVVNELLSGRMPRTTEKYLINLKGYY